MSRETDQDMFRPFLSEGKEDVESSDNDNWREEAVSVISRRRVQKRFIGSLVLNGALLVLLVMGYFILKANSKPEKLLPTPVPEFSREIRTFKLDPLFLSLPDEESTAAWEALPGPNGRGFIELEPDNPYNFPDTKAGLSVFHQLHCLGALRKFIWMLMYDEVDREAMLQTWPENVTNPAYDQAINGMWHYAHCLDYLRQGVQCSADLSLEFVSQSTGRAVVDGLDYPHECANWDEIWEYSKIYG
ncbi:hypothetical protein BKA67DRAFT_652743 [Truncatella angustata]|uniref:Oxidase ustYa n=1 Tax=Truncatella angustata TaxID=152316 RepID=A0A9P8UWK3_9PEZI|nr:uncharacterized protein BKA67DRAFT_652743 [Truncatella angustata]KAH6659513.1 hypothetical protein BKA67DRAFT_652743 [Truncatella angustata]